MKKLFSIGIAVIGCFLFTNATGQEAPPPGPNLPCPWGWAEIYRAMDDDFNNLKSHMCDCESTDWFMRSDPASKRCSEVIE